MLKKSVQTPTTRKKFEFPQSREKWSDSYTEKSLVLGGARTWERWSLRDFGRRLCSGSTYSAALSQFSRNSFVLDTVQKTQLSLCMATSIIRSLVRLQVERRYRVCSRFAVSKVICKPLQKVNGVSFRSVVLKSG
ncbi:hypothetical protein Mp_7g02580 [Marchantia polymorpha subsp. ruderalis]|uniref:Uncharacterized protein n=2 Tax=Marchantia polymorpha TaxID=3197 RepID=A0AAF6BVF3_MARPO|nr:hypothetical protein MARPO_0088s0030 [Marchantia polymorpha]BBN15987.1 hypothetical protein Mp_7g02580 [Marchantia polymorpha subsp. ruderalis]|eukprot:PTQ33484.1 hypothetical protein MARPO_0088s0030 [Marchantia polymorpha]